MIASPGVAGRAAGAAAGAAAIRPPRQRPRSSALDFFSADFNPALALRTAGLQPPLPVAPLESWEAAAQLAEADALTYRELGESAVASLAIVPSSSPSACAVPPPSLLPLSRVPSLCASAPLSLFPTGDGSSLLDTLDDAQCEQAQQRADATQAATLAAASAPPSSGSSVCPAPVDSSSRMSADQIRSNQLKAAQRALDRQQLKEKSAHFMDRFTSLFPVPKPISTPAMRARAAAGPMALLRTMHQRALKVFVVIRRSHGLRCILHAYLSAFDKHWNLLLLDVDESYSEWDWRLCGRGTVQQLLQDGTRFQLPNAKTRRHPRGHEQDQLKDKPEGAMDESPESADAAAALSSVPAVAAAAAAAAAASTPPVVRLPSHIRVETMKQRHVHQLYVRGDSVVSVCEFAPTLCTPQRMTASEAAAAAATLLSDRLSGS